MGQRGLAFLGVTAKEEAVYRLLLRRGELGGDELDLIGEPPGGGLSKRLTALGLARETADGVLHPVSPARAVERLVDSAVGHLRAKLEEEAAVSRVVDSLIAEREVQESEWRQAEGDAVIQRLEGMEEVRAAIDELTFFTWTESLTTNPGGVLSADTIDHARPIDDRVLRRGVHMRTLLGSAALKDAPTMAYARELVAKGAEIRISRAPLERLIICDRSAALTPIDPAHSARGAILTRESGLVAALVSLFERMWDAAEELPSEDAIAAPAADELGDIERQVLLLLCTAAKDENGARALGVAVRTYRKYVAELMQRLDANNRFHAALRARERGWV